jgi:hypothetical protein
MALSLSHTCRPIYGERRSERESTMLEMAAVNVGEA